MDVTGGLIMFDFFIIIILGIALLLFGMELIDDKQNNGILGFLCIIISVGLFLYAIKYVPNNNSNKPKAIDVYRGKTELEITYRDTIAIDSTVVWKKEYEKVSD